MSQKQNKEPYIGSILELLDILFVDLEVSRWAGESREAYEEIIRRLEKVTEKN